MKKWVCLSVNIGFLEFRSHDNTWQDSDLYRNYQKRPPWTLLSRHVQRSSPVWKEPHPFLLIQSCSSELFHHSKFKSHHHKLCIRLRQSPALCLDPIIAASANLSSAFLCHIFTLRGIKVSWKDFCGAQKIVQTNQTFQADCHVMWFDLVELLKDPFLKDFLNINSNPNSKMNLRHSSWKCKWASYQISRHETIQPVSFTFWSDCFSF